MHDFVTHLIDTLPAVLAVVIHSIISWRRGKTAQDLAIKTKLDLQAIMNKVLRQNGKTQTGL